MYMRKRSGPRMFPWGTPDITGKSDTFNIMKSI